MSKLTGPRLTLLRVATLLCAVFLPCVLSQAQSFLQPTVIPTGNWPAAIYTADVNGDGYPDLIYIDHGATPNQPSTTHVLLNDGKGNFTQSAVLSTVGRSLAIGNLLGTGRVDIGWVTSTLNTNGYTIYSLTAYDGKGDGTFNGATTNNSAVQSGSKAAVWDYLTALQVLPNGQADVLAEDLANGVLWEFRFGFFLPTGGGGPLPQGTGPITIADLNNDGYQDVVINSVSTATATTFLYDSTRKALDTGTQSRLSPIGPIRSLLLKDVNNDGRPDLIAETTNGHIDVYPGNGDGTFSTTSIGGTGPLDGLTGNGGHLIALADLNHDGQIDALTATPAGISTLLGGGTQYLKLGGIYNAGPGHTSYALADFNGDGNLDLALDSPEGIAILYGNPDGSFQTSRSYAAGAPALSGTTGVFTASGHPDSAVSVSPSQAQLLQGNGDGTFQSVPVPPTSSTASPGLWSTVFTGDFNGDGKADLLLSVDGSAQAIAGTNAYALTLLSGQGDGTFQLSNPDANVNVFNNCTLHHPQYFGTTAVADLNGDGITDAAKLTPDDLEILHGAAGNTTLYPGSGTSSSTDPCSVNAHDLVAIDFFTNPITPDFIYQFEGHLELLRNDGKGNLAAPNPLVGDLSIDGSLTTPGQLTAPNISPTFGGVSTTFNQPYFPGAIATGDLDRDGNTDLLVTYANLSADPTNPSTATPNYLYIWYGSGNGKFLTSPAHPVNPVRTTLSRNYYQVKVADLNHDGIPDLILSDGYLVSYQLGLGDGTFGPEHHLLAGQGINTISTADLRGVGTQDLVLANGGAALSNPVVNHETLAADPDVNTGGITVLLNGPAPKTATQPTLTVSPEPSVFFTSYTLTFDPAGNGGTVTFSQDGTVLGTVTTTGNIVTYTVPAGNEYLPGAHSLTADLEFPGLNLDLLTTATHTITRAPTTVTLIPTTPLTVYYGQQINGTFNITSVDPTYPANGNYTLLDNGQPVAICTNIPVVQSCPYGAPILLDAGPHVFSIQYLGDPVNAPSTSPNYPYQVLPDLTTLTLASSKNPATFGDSVTFTATLAGNAAPPVGPVNFFDNGNAIGSATLTPGPNNLSIATFTSSTLAVGTHPITAVYPATLDFNAAASAVYPQVILPVQPPPPPPPTGPASFVMTATPNALTLGVGRTGVITVSITAVNGFNQPVALSCANLAPETTCVFLPAIVPAGGGTANLQLLTNAPRDCGTNTPYFLGLTTPLPRWPIAPGAITTALVFFAFRKRRLRLAKGLLLAALTTTLIALSGCGHCTDLGTRPGHYTFQLIATAQGTPVTETQTITIPLTTTIP